MSARAAPEQRRVTASSSGNITLMALNNGTVREGIGSTVGGGSGLGTTSGGVDAGSSLSPNSSTSPTNSSRTTSIGALSRPSLLNKSNSGMNNNNGHRSGGGKSSKLAKAEALARFHPKMITAQIVSLQCFQYLVQSILIQTNAFLFHVPASVDRIFTDRYIHIWKREGWADCFVILLSAFTGAFALMVIVEKSKKCLDFSFTYFMLHLVLSCFCGNFPSTFDWWIMHVLALLVMVILGEYLCSLKELEMIPLLPLIG